MLLESTAYRNHQYQIKSMQNEIKQLQQQLHFQKSEHETAMAINEGELQRSAQSCREARKELQSTLKTNEELLLQNEDLVL